MDQSWPKKKLNGVHELISALRYVFETFCFKGVTKGPKTEVTVGISIVVCV